MTQAMTKEQLVVRQPGQALCLHKEGDTPGMFGGFSGGPPQKMSCGEAGSFIAKPWS